MPRENKSKYAVLGLLSYKPMSGYDIKNLLDEGMNNFWSESYGQIYPILEKLRNAGLATRSVEKNEGKPDRHVYTITDEGRSELDTWLLKPADSEKVRFELLLKVFFGAHMPIEDTIRHLEGYRQSQLDNLAHLVEDEKRLPNDYAGEAGLPYWLMTIWCGQYVGRAMVEWCNESIAYLNELSKSSSEHADQP